MTNHGYTIVPLGGLGVFGMNMMAIGYDDRWLLVDCGKMFPEDRAYGIEAIIPDFAFVRDNIDKFVGLFLTHGHEDHIGAVTNLMKECPMPIYATPLTIGMVEMRLREYNLHKEIDLIEVERGNIVDVEPFSVHFVGVSHGIPDSCSLAIRTQAGVIIHTGDFKIDHTPLDDQTFDYHTFAAYGREGVLLLMSDSTNVERSGYTFSEREVFDGFLKIFTEATGKILVASFASHLHRMQQIVDLADEFGRKVTFCGRSMEQNTRLAKEMGYLDVPFGLEVSNKDAMKLPPDQVVVIASGSQAEPNSALTKIALDSHPYIKLKPGDTVALSARKIPGNERAIASIINHLYRRGAEVIHDGVLDIHVSGHGAQEELKMMINLAAPKFFMPIHGEYRQLHLHAGLARRLGIPDENVLLAQDGDVVEVNEERIAISGRTQVGYVLVDRSESDELDPLALQDRRILAAQGVVIPIVALELNGKPRVVTLQFLTKALASEQDGLAALQNLEKPLTEMIQACSIAECRDGELMKAKIGKAVRKELLKSLKTRPMILPVILEV